MRIQLSKEQSKFIPPDPTTLPVPKDQPGDTRLGDKAQLTSFSSVAKPTDRSPPDVQRQMTTASGLMRAPTLRPSKVKATLAGAQKGSAMHLELKDPINDEDDGEREMTFDPKATKFETDLRYYRELFRLREMRQRDKYDFFWGPYIEDTVLAQRINFNRIKRHHKRKVLLAKRVAAAKAGQGPLPSARSFDKICCDEDLVCPSDSDEQDVSGVVRGNPYDLENYYMKFEASNAQTKPDGFVADAAERNWALVYNLTFGNKQVRQYIFKCVNRM